MAKLRYVIENLPFIIIKWVIIKPFLCGFHMGLTLCDSKTFQTFLDISPISLMLDIGNRIIERKGGDNEA